MNEEYSNRARGERNADTSSDSTSTLHLDETPPERKSTANGARLIQKVYEVDPLARYPGEFHLLNRKIQHGALHPGQSGCVASARTEIPCQDTRQSLKPPPRKTTIQTTHGFIFLSLE